jgi:hypothetical protein
MLIRKLLLPGYDEISNLHRSEKHHLYLHVVIKLTRSFSVENLKKKKELPMTTIYFTQFSQNEES